jgi:hypothetical protein
MALMLVTTANVVLPLALASMNQQLESVALDAYMLQDTVSIHRESECT